MAIERIFSHDQVMYAHFLRGVGGFLHCANTELPPRYALPLDPPLEKGEVLRVNECA